MIVQTRMYVRSIDSIQVLCGPAEPTQHDPLAQLGCQLRLWFGDYEIVLNFEDKEHLKRFQELLANQDPDKYVQQYGQ